MVTAPGLRGEVVSGGYCTWDARGGGYWWLLGLGCQETGGYWWLLRLGRMGEAVTGGSKAAAVTGGCCPWAAWGWRRRWRCW